MKNSYTSTPRWTRKSLLTVSIPLLILVSVALAASIAHAQTPDFAVNGAPPVLCVNPGIDAVSSISVQSVDGFAGTVNIAASIDSPVTISPIPSTETLAAGQTITFNVTMYTTTSTPLYTYYLRVSGISNGVFHQTTVQLTVAAGCSVGGVVVPAAGLAPMTSYLGYGLAIAGALGIVGASLAVYVSRRKPNPTS
jgi:hypothetical protein